MTGRALLLHQVSSYVSPWNGVLHFIIDRVAAVYPLPATPGVTFLSEHTLPDIADGARVCVRGVVVHQETSVRSIPWRRITLVTDDDFALRIVTFSPAHPHHA